MANTNTYGIGSERIGTGDTYRQSFYIVEQGVRLPMQFSTSDAAWQHVQLLKAGPQLTRDEILDVVAEHIAKQPLNPITAALRPH